MINYKRFFNNQINFNGQQILEKKYLNYIKFSDVIKSKEKKI